MGTTDTKQRRPKGTGGIRERGKNSWEIRYSLGTNPATGKRRIATATVRGLKKDAEKELRRLQRTQDTGEHVDPNRITVADWLKTWLAAVRPEVSPKSHERYQQLADGFLVPELGNYHIGKLTPANIQTAYAKWAIDGRLDGKEGGLAPRTRRHIHHILRCSLARAVEQQVLARNPADVFRRRLPKVERKDMTALTADQSATLLDAVKHTRVYWPSLIALATGLRRGEILALRWKSIDLDAATLRVVESLEETKALGLRFKSPKTERARGVVLPRYAVDELRRLKKEQAEELLRLGIRQCGDTLVCARADGDPLRPRSLTHEFTRMVANIKAIPRVRFHDLRHSHATQLLAAGVHPKIAQERLGHSTIATTMNLYSHVTETMQVDAADRLDAAFRSAKSGRPAS